jgi:hypothetical protein
VLLPSPKVEVLLLNSILSRVRSSGVLGLTTAEDMVLLMDLMGLTVMVEVATEDPHLRNTRDALILHHLTLMILHHARPAPTTLLQRAIIHAPSPLSHPIIRVPVLLMDLIIIEAVDADHAVDITTTIDMAHLTSPSI